MPHDSKNQLVQKGDHVIIRGQVANVSEGPDFCNLTVSIAPMPPYTDSYTLTLNTRQVEKVDKPQ